MAKPSKAEESRVWRTGLQLRDAEPGDPGPADRLTHMEGRAVPYDVWEHIGYYAERIAPGAFDKSIRESARALPLMLWHDARQWPIGKAVEWRSEKDGLYGVWELDESPAAQQAGRLARDGFLDGLSVGFQPMPNRSDWEWADLDDPESVDRVTRNEARLFEVSLVPYPAYADAGVTLVRTGEARRRAEAALPKLRGWRAWRDSISA